MGIVTGAVARHFLPFAGDEKETMFLPATLEAYMAESASFMRVSLISPGLPASLTEDRAATPKDAVIMPLIPNAFSPPGCLFLRKTKPSMVFLISSAIAKASSGL